MKPLLRISLNLLGWVACITALGTLATVLFDALTGAPGNVGPLGAWVVGGLLLGQFRILWVLMNLQARPGRRSESVPLPAVQPLRTAP